MEKIETFELDRWSEPDEQNRVKHIGMADAKETFEKLEAHLKEKGMLPDEYFLYDVDMRTKARELLAPMIKCKKTPKKKCRFMAERKKKR